MIYIAGPFFNPAQAELIGYIENTLRAFAVPFVSPRLQGENKKPGPLSASDAETIFTRNLGDIRRSTHMLAVVDWLMPKGQYVSAVLMDETEADRPIGPALNIPDSGTVWEMGFCLGIRRQHYMRLMLYTERKPEEGLNLMLTQGCHGVIYGRDQLADAAAGGFDLNHLSRWKGKHQ